MTAEQKMHIAFFLDTAGDYLRDGYKRSQGEYHFTDDRQEPVTEPQGAVIPVTGMQPVAGMQSEPAPKQETDSLETITAEIRGCTRCALHTARKQTVPGEGVKRPLVLVAGEGPGADEGASGKPFVGKAGQLLDKMLSAVNLSRERNCFITNVVKCRPPHNRDPLPEEIASCAGFLARQIKVLKPLIVLSAGRISTQALLNTAEGIGKLRGTFTEYAGLPLLPVYHPSALLRDESLKRPAWEDLKTLRNKLAELDEHYALEIREGG